MSRLLQVGEVVEVKTDPKFAYGKLGRAPDVPPNAHVHYVIALLEINPPFEFGSMPPQVGPVLPMDVLIPYCIGKSVNLRVIFACPSSPSETPPLF